MKHPNLVLIYDFENLGDMLVLAMEYCSGGSLAEGLKAMQQAGKPIAIEVALRIATEVAEGLAEIHALDAVHRDLKPSNILFDARTQAR